MTPEERLTYQFQQSEQRHQQQLREIQRQTQECPDRLAFQVMQASSPVAKKYAGEVERLFQEQYRKGGFVDRQTILKFVVGEKVLARGQQVAPKQRRQAAQRVAQQQTRSGSPRGAVSGRMRGEKSLEDRLADVTF